MRKEWTNKEEALLLRLKAEGKSITQIAQALGRNRGSIAGHLWFYNRDRNILSWERIKEVVKSVY